MATQTVRQVQRLYQVTMTGTASLLLHHDNIEWADKMDAWKDDPKNKGKSKAGDDRTPAFRWIGNCYSDGEHLAVPTDNIMRSLMEGATMVPVPGGRSGKTFKAQSQSGMLPDLPHWKLHTADGLLIPIAEVEQLQNEPDFAKHLEAVEKMGFELNVKRARVQQAKHIRVRPWFREGWKVSGIIRVWDEKITDETLSAMLFYAGSFKGIGDWRPSSPKTPGRYGTFEATCKRVSDRKA